MSVYDNGGVGTPMGGGPRPAIVRFDAISEAFNLVKLQLGPWVLSFLVYIVIVYAVIIPISFALGIAPAMMGARGGSNGPSNAQVAGQIGGLLFGQLILMLLVSAMASYFITGFYRMALKQIRGGTIAIGDLFSGTDAIVPMFLTVLLTSLGVGAGEMLCVIPGLLLAGLWMFAPFLVADQKMAPIDAMRLSFNTLKSQMWPALGFLIVAGLVASLGGLLCGVGVLFTAPIGVVALAIVYNDFFGNGTSYAQSTIDMPLPPSNPSF